MIRKKDVYREGIEDSKQIDLKRTRIEGACLLLGLCNWWEKDFKTSPIATYAASVIKTITDRSFVPTIAFAVSGRQVLAADLS